VVGLSAGHTIAHVIAMEGLAGEIAWPTLTRWNCRTESDTASVLDLGVNKAVVAARRIAEIDPYCEWSSNRPGFVRRTWVSFLMDSTSVIEECDSLDMSSSCARRRAIVRYRDHGDE